MDDCALKSPKRPKRAPVIGKITHLEATENAMEPSSDISSTTLSSLPVAAALAFLIALTFTPCVSLAHAQSPGDRTDAVIETDVINAIESSPVLKDQQITAATIEGDVTLSGNVKDKASKELAQALAGRVAGVHSVVNNLVIGSAPSAAAQPMPSANGQDAPVPEPLGSEPAQTQPPQTGQEGPQQQNGPPQGYGVPRPRYDPQANQQAPNPAYRQPQTFEPVTVPQGTLLKVRLSEPLDSKKTQNGTIFEATAANDVYVGGVLAIPMGATLQGQVVEVKTPSGSLHGSSSISLRLTNLVLEGRTYPLQSDVWTSEGPGKGAYSINNTIGGAAIGAMIGAIAGGGEGAAIGATAGGATGAAASAASSGPRVILPPEALLNFHLASPASVVPVTYQEAQRLASSVPQPRGPYMQRRVGYPPPAPVVVYGGYGYPYYYGRRAYYYGYPYGW